jgi:polysaccharide biosynthesis transport protein
VGSEPGLIHRATNVLFHPLSLFRVHPPRSDKEKSDDLKLGVLRTFEKRLTVGRLGNSYIITIEFQSTNPARAAQIANAVADSFIIDQQRVKYETIGKASAWLQDRLDELRAQAAAAERAVVEYKAKNNIVNTGGRLFDEQQLTELNTALTKARADRVDAQARLDRLSQIIRSDNLDPSATEVATVADALHSEIISRLRQQYLDLAQREALYSGRLGKEHLAVVNIRNQMREIRRSTADELKRIAESYKSEYNIATARENSVKASLAAAIAGSQTTNKAQIELRQLEAAAQSYRVLYDNFQQRYTDSVQQQSFPIAEARIITRASPQLEKTSPKSSRILAIATMGGLVIGLGLGLLREFGDRVFRTSRQVEAKLGTECLALVPMIKVARSLDTNSAAEMGNSRIMARKPGVAGYLIDSPLSRFAETIRAVKLSADLSGLAKSSKVIGITSSLPNEGKSTIASCLAQLSAHAGARVILVDCDLRQPSLSQELAPNRAKGLIEVITETARLEEVIWRDPSTNLSFLPVVAKSRLTHTSEILASNAVKRLFDRLRESYDYVIVDLSPLAPVVDVRSTAQFIDAYVFVIEWGKTKIDVVEHALNAARGVYDNLLGVVLNKVDVKGLRRYDSHRSDYYYNRYYERYGYTD